MIRYVMPDIDREDIHIPGGWEARIPSMKLYDNERNEYVGYYMRQGMNEARAYDKVLHHFTQLWVRAWLQTLKVSIVHMAKRYKKMHPDLGLRGFKPEMMQAAYVPGDHVGVRGKPAVTELLRKMGEQERAKLGREA